MEHTDPFLVHRKIIATEERVVPRSLALYWSTHTMYMDSVYIIGDRNGQRCDKPSFDTFDE